MTKICKATKNDYIVVSELVTELLLELEPETEEKLKEINIPKITQELLKQSKIVVFLAFYNKIPVGVITLHESAAIYAGGLFAEISELFVKPKYRSNGIGKKLIVSVREEAIHRSWARIEVGAPNRKEWARTFDFYTDNGFKEIGPRLRSIV